VADFKVGDRVEYQENNHLCRGTVVNFDWGSSFTTVKTDTGLLIGRYSYHMRLLSPLETFIEQV
jgi:hypothetical protein